MVEMMVVLAVFAILTGIAAPNLKSWMRIYRLRSAATDLLSNMQLAKVSAVRENRQWKIRFDTANRHYQVLRCLTATCEAGTLNTDYTIPKTVSLTTRYKNEVRYQRPGTGEVIDIANPLVFNAGGMVSDDGFVYFSNDINTTYYRVGFQSMAGAVRVQRWTGAAWE